MKTIEITENVSEVIIKYKDNTEKVIKNEEKIYVPECIGLDDEKHCYLMIIKVGFMLKMVCIRFLHL